MKTYRILTVDDMPALHEDFRKLLCPGPRTTANLGVMQANLFGEATPLTPHATFELSSALQGQLALELVRAARDEGRPFAMAFVDMRMPPGWDGLQTIEALWREDPNLEVVICTAYSDYSEEQIVKRLRASDQLLILKKPFEAIEVRQLARALTEKWALRQEAHARMGELERHVASRTRELAASNQVLASEMQRLAGIEAQLAEAQKYVDVGKLTVAIASDLALAAAAVRDALSAGPNQLVAAADRITELASAVERLARDVPRSRTTLDIDRAIQTIVALTGNALHGRAAIHTELAAIPPIECSPADLNLVLFGVVDSAVQATEAAAAHDRAEGNVTIATRVDGDSAVIEVSDTGDPLGDAERLHVFDAFNQFGRSGLALARSIVVDQHGGQLTVEPNVPHGTVVTIRLPLARAA